MACQEAGLILRTTLVERQLIRNRVEKSSKSALFAKKGQKFDISAHPRGSSRLAVEWLLETPG